MSEFGEKIKKLRKAAGCSQQRLADALDISIKSVQRYEKGDNPDHIALAKLAEYFGVSSDYLLGIMGSKERAAEEARLGLEDECIHLYKQYLQCRNHYTIDEDAEYYWISLDEDGTPGGMGGWNEAFGSFRPVLPGAAIASCTSAFGKPMVINSQADALAFVVYGGHAIVKAEIYEKYLKKLFVMGEVV